MKIHLKMKEDGKYWLEEKEVLKVIKYLGGINVKKLKGGKNKK